MTKDNYTSFINKNGMFGTPSLGTTSSSTLVTPSNSIFSAAKPSARGDLKITEEYLQYCLNTVSALSSARVGSTSYGAEFLPQVEQFIEELQALQTPQAILSY